MTSNKESWSAGREALREVTEHSDWPVEHESAMARYLASEAYAERETSAKTKTRPVKRPSRKQQSR
jgi:hypothetical protein